MIKLGITGGIGTGKSIVSKILVTLGIPVFNSDEQSKKILFSNNEIKLNLTNRFGNSILDNNHIIDSKKLAQIVFSHKDSLKYLESILHPLVKEAFALWCVYNKDKTIVAKEAAILIESGTYKDLDYIISVNAAMDIRIKRIKDRDKISEKLIQQKMSKQLTMEEINKKAQFIINNSGDIAIIPQIMSILEALNYDKKV